MPNTYKIDAENKSRIDAKIDANTDAKYMQNHPK